MRALSKRKVPLSIIFDKVKALFTFNLTFHPANHLRVLHVLLESVIDVQQCKVIAVNVGKPWA